MSLYPVSLRGFWYLNSDLAYRASAFLYLWDCFLVPHVSMFAMVYLSFWKASEQIFGISILKVGWNRDIWKPHLLWVSLGWKLCSIPIYPFVKGGSIPSSANMPMVWAITLQIFLTLFTTVLFISSFMALETWSFYVDWTLSNVVTFLSLSTVWWGVSLHCGRDTIN